jgi:O-antigen/teichoic acid export membrane protein
MKNVFWKSILFLVSVIFNIILVRKLKAGLTAEFYTFIYFLSILVQIFTFGLDIGLNYFLVRNRISLEKVNTLILIVVSASLFISIPVIGYSYYKNGSAGYTIGETLLFSCLFMAGRLLTVFSSAVLTSFHANERAVKISVYFTIGLVVIAGLLETVSDSIVARNILVSLYFASGFLQGILIFVAAARYGCKGKWFDTIDLKDLAAILQFSLYTFIISLIFFVAGRLGVFLIEGRVSLDAAGNYLQAFKVTEFIQAIVFFVYFPFVSIIATSTDNARSSDYVLFLLRISNSFVVFVSAAIFFLGPFVFPLIYGSSFDGVYPVLIYFIPGLFAACSSMFITAYFFGSGHNRFNLASACVMLLSMLVLYLIFKQNYDGKMAALSFSVSSILSYILDLIFLRKGASFSLNDIGIIKRRDILLVRDLLISAVASNEKP